MIDLVDITKTYLVNGKTFHGLKGITLSIGRGEFVSIMGPSGSGKSTLSSILGCLASPSSGVYKLDGQIVTEMNGSELADLRNGLIGFVFQDFNLLDGLPVVENVALPLIYAKVPAHLRRIRAMERLEQMGLGHKAKNLPYQLSGGQKQRVAIARALVTNPSLIFADEPTGALDKKTGNDIMGILQDLNRQGQTVVQVTHSPEHGNYGKRIVYIVDGLIVRDELVARPILAKGMDQESSSVETELITKLWHLGALAPKEDAEATEAMATLLEQKNNSTSFMEAAKALAIRSGPKVEALLEGLLHSPEAIVRAETLRQLEKGNLNFAIHQWWQAVEDENGWVKFVAISMLRRYVKDWQETNKILFTKLAKDSDERVRATAIGKVGEWQETVYEPVLVGAFFDSDARVRANALDGLQLLGERAGLESKKCFEQGLEDPNNRVKANAAVANYLFHPGRSKQILFQMLDDKNNLMRASAAWAIGKLLLFEGVELLLEKLVSERNDVVVSRLVMTLGLFSQRNISFKVQMEKILKIKTELLDTPVEKRAA